VSTGEGDVVEQSESPLTAATIHADLCALGVEPGMTLIVHASIRALGWVCGDAQALLEALLAALPQGTLVMPAQSTHLSDPSRWNSPPVPASWWQAIRESMPAYDPHLTPTRGMGRLAELFRSQPATLRSAHPLYSFAACGPRAAEVVAPHALEHGLDELSPLGRLYRLGAHVLLLGVGHESNTSLHLAEHRASYPGKHWIREGTCMRVGGQPRWLEFDELDFDDGDFAQLGAAFEAAAAVRRGRVGAAECRLMPQRELLDFAVPWMERNRAQDLFR
jgi:aminoglycoside 3-N-acetyltransferase